MKEWPLIKQCLEFSPFPIFSPYVLLILELKATTKSFPKMRHSVLGIAWLTAPEDLFVFLVKVLLRFYLCEACALFRRFGRW